MTWHERAACAGKTRIFFPEAGDDHDALARIAREICARCPVIDECKADTADYERTLLDIHGFRHAMTEAERREAWQHRRNQVPVRIRKQTARNVRTVKILTEAGFSANEIAAELGCSQRAVVRMRHQARQLTDEQLLLCS